MKIQNYSISFSFSACQKQQQLARGDKKIEKKIIFLNYSKYHIYFIGDVYHFNVHYNLFQKINAVV